MHDLTYNAGGFTVILGYGILAVAKSAMCCFWKRLLTLSLPSDDVMQT